MYIYKIVSGQGEIPDWRYSPQVESTRFGEIPKPTVNTGKFQNTSCARVRMKETGCIF